MSSQNTGDSRMPQTTSSGNDQRESLERSQKRATRTEPENFRDQATAEKVVEIGADRQDDPIKGIDPEETPKPSR